MRFPTLSEKKRPTNLSKCQQQELFSSVCMLLLQLASINVFYSALLHFRTPSIVIDDSSWKNAAECFTVALTLTLGGTKVQ